MVKTAFTGNAGVPGQPGVLPAILSFLHLHLRRPHTSLAGIFCTLFDSTCGVHGIITVLLEEKPDAFNFELVTTLSEEGHYSARTGTALRLAYGSPRFSDDLDFSIRRQSPHSTLAPHTHGIAPARPYALRVDR